ncbi:lysM and putative peptidoglycan-binding domain-containing protein 2-like isoform X2 [Entelurus aequoreus]|uniref:lysM and putative peptidoglycan-binding domain-containing protein 2-like isoform X2 n=1 Tax=Entelurus aequoreus TaxID=161455 RepID=UPI002B1DE107|nr:lysM and putative peptidoglycan-binding domain-containing protein 2-like isoform X2 [Entelurus aequoreus]
MADFPPVLEEEGGGRLGQHIFARSRSGSESESELSQSLARTKIRSYGSTASVSASLGEKYIEHRLSDGDTLQGIALKYNVTMEQIKRANKLFSNDCIFLKSSLNIPVATQKRYIFNGLSLESPDGDDQAAQQQEDQRPWPEDSKGSGPPAEELSAQDFLTRLDLQIKRSKQAAARLKEEEVSLSFAGAMR